MTSHPAEVVDRLLNEVIPRLTRELCGRAITTVDPDHCAYQTRLRACVEYHAERFGEGRPVPPARVIERLERGALSVDRHRLERRRSSFC